jgi:hypothetical protein
MKRLNQTRGFAEQFEMILNLTTEQVTHLDNLEFEIYKDYFWNHSTTEDKLKFRFLTNIFKLLSSDQILKLKEYKKSILLKAENKIKGERQMSFEYEKRRLSTLKLSDETILKYVLAKEDLMKTYKEKMVAQLKIGKKISDIKSHLEEEYYRPLFTEDEYYLYKDILKQEHEEAESFSFKQAIQNFEYQYAIKLTEDQAKKIFDLENKSDDFILSGECFSEFEQEERKLLAYKNILDTDQYITYNSYYEKRIEQLKDELIASNNNHHLQQMNRSKEYLEYYILAVLPAMSIARKNLDVFLTPRQKEIIQEINVYYFKRLEEMRVKYIADHERYNKDLVPNELLEFQYRFKLDCVCPNIHLLMKHDLLIEELLTDSLVLEIKREKISLKKVHQDLEVFKRENYESNGGKYGMGWLIKVPYDEVEEHLNYISILLIEPDFESNIERMERFA